VVCQDRSFSDSYDRASPPIGPFVPCLDNPPTTPNERTDHTPVPAPGEPAQRALHCGRSRQEGRALPLIGPLPDGKVSADAIIPIMLRLTEAGTYPSGTPHLTDETGGVPLHFNITDQQEGPSVQATLR
jgi:hypothetical protein